LVASVSSRQTVDELVGNASYVSSVAFAQDGALIVSAAGDRTARVWDAASGVQLAELRGHESLVRNATFGRDGQTVATASEDGTLRLWQLPVTTVVRSTSELADAVVSKDGRRIVSATRDGTIDVSDVPSGRRTARFTVRGLARFAVSPSASAIAAIEGSGHVRARDPGRPEAPVDIAEPGAEVRALDYSPDGRSIALATYTGAIRVVDTSGRVRRMLRLPELAPLTVVAFSPDGRRIAAGAPLDNTIVVVDARTGRELRRIRPEDSGITSLAFSPDASLLIAGGNDGASIWNASTGRLRLRLRGHRAAVQTSTFSPSGDLVETASFDGEARLWDATTGDLLTSLAGRTGSFGGDRYVLTTTGRVARLYACDACGSLAALQARGRDRVTRQFSDAQLRPYIEG
jgi:WD40 repeat protein